MAAYIFIEYRQRNEDALSEWLHAIRRDVGAHFAVTANTRVCSSHFKESDYRSTYRGGAVRLQSDAVPSVFAWAKTTARRRPLLRRSRDEPDDGESSPLGAAQPADPDAVVLTAPPRPEEVPPTPPDRLLSMITRLPDRQLARAMPMGLQSSYKGRPRPCEVKIKTSAREL